MDGDFVLYIGRQAMETSLLVSAPILITCMVVGIVITLFQAVTSIRDMSLTVVPKLLAAGFVCLLFGNWSLSMIVRFTQDIFSYIQQIGN